MALADDPRAFILRMFQMETNEGRGAHCQTFPAGLQLDGLKLEAGELVYGIYKNKYIFTPSSLILKGEGDTKKVTWSQISACSTVHGSGERFSVLTLTDGSTVEIALHELAKGWSGRVSQLFHGMIVRWGKKASLGHELLSADEFFRRVKDPYEFAPNLKPHPSLQRVLQLLKDLVSAPEVKTVLLSSADAPAEGLAVTSVVVVANGRPVSIENFALDLNASSVIEASENLRRKAKATDQEKVWAIVWD